MPRSNVKMLLIALLSLFGVAAVMPVAAGPAATPLAGETARASLLSDLVSPAATRLCGRGLSGRCTKGRAACTRGSAADCARWTAWSKACSKCAAAFAQCRSNARNSCESCIAAHDACEARAR